MYSKDNGQNNKSIVSCPSTIGHTARNILHTIQRVLHFAFYLSTRISLRIRFCSTKSHVFQKTYFRGLRSEDHNYKMAENAVSFYFILLTSYRLFSYMKNNVLVEL